MSSGLNFSGQALGLMNERLLPGFKRVAWPPPPDETESEPVFEEQAPVHSQDPAYTRAKTVPSTLIEPQRFPEKPTTAPQPAFEAQVPVSAYRPVSFEPPPRTITLRPSPPIQQVRKPSKTETPESLTVACSSRRRLRCSIRNRRRSTTREATG